MKWRAIYQFLIVVDCYSACYDGQIRFENTNYSYVNGLYSYGGRVEVCSGDVYHPVCDEGWTDNDATVVCRYIGYGPPYYRELKILTIFCELTLCNRC